MNEWMPCCRWIFFLVVNLLFFHIYELLWWLHKGMRNAIQYYQISYKKVGNCEKKKWIHVMLFIYYKFYECCVGQLEIQVHTIYFTSNSAIPGKVEIQAHTISFICSSAILCKVNIQAHSFEQWCTNITCNMRSGNQYIALPLGFKWISGIRRICCTLRRKFEVPKNWYSSLSLYLYKYLSYLSFPALRRKYF